MIAISPLNPVAAVPLKRAGRPTALGVWPACLAAASLIWASSALAQATRTSSLETTRGSTMSSQIIHGAGESSVPASVKSLTERIDTLLEKGDLAQAIAAKD